MEVVIDADRPAAPARQFAPGAPVEHLLSAYFTMVCIDPATGKPVKGTLPVLILHGCENRVSQV
jgi:alpha-beta hydrolase superfamily lysophospholipase